MKPITPRQVVLLIAAAVALAVGLTAAVVVHWSLLPGLLPILLVAVAAFVTTYALASYGVKRFIQDRLRTIYKTVQGLRASGGAQEVVDLDTDVLGRVNSEVEDWASARRSEILELKERENFRREFIGNLAHELKTPIFNIQGYILTLLEGGLEDEKVNRDFLKRASHGVDRLIKIVEDLDLITKLESGVMDLSLRRNALHEVVNEAIESVDLAAAEKGIMMRNQVPDNVAVQVDRDRLIQVFVNLFVNAINYGHEGGHCTVAVDDLDDRVVVEVSDDGIGISQEHLPRLFERFYRVGKSRARNEGGSGLGLAIVKHIIDAHGQTITVKSKEGAGTSFVFTLRKVR